METTLQLNEVSPARAAKVAGSLYVITMATSMIAEIVCFQPLVISGNPAATAQNILAHTTQFRLGIVMMLLTALGVVPLFWGLYIVVRSYNRDLALLAVLFRLTETAVICTALTNHLVSLKYLGKAKYLSAFEPIQLHTLSYLSISTYGSALYMGFVCLGFGSTIFAYLFYKSGYVPKFIGAWGIFASLLIGLSCLANFVFPQLSPFVYPFSMVPMFFYEVGLGLWLWIKGVKTA